MQKNTHMQSNVIEITLGHECSPVNLLHIFRTPFLENTSGWLLLLILSIIIFMLSHTICFSHKTLQSSRQIFYPNLDGSEKVDPYPQCIIKFISLLLKNQHILELVLGFMTDISEIRFQHQQKFATIFLLTKN